MDNNRANQMNPNNFRYWRARGYPGRPVNWASGGGNGPVVGCGETIIRGIINVGHFIGYLAWETMKLAVNVVGFGVQLIGRLLCCCCA